MRRVLATLLLVLFLAACGDVAPTQTPIVIIVTATPIPAPATLTPYHTPTLSGKAMQATSVAAANAKLATAQSNLNAQYTAIAVANHRIDATQIAINIHGVDYYYAVTVDFASTFEKPIKLFRGTLTLSDPFHAPLAHLDVTDTQPLTTRGTHKWTGTYDYSPSRDAQLFQFVKANTLAYDWHLTQILYADGTTEQRP